MTEKRRKYSKEFKLEAIRMYQNGERSIKIYGYLSFRCYP